jgi:hypothetical protein
MFVRVSIWAGVLKPWAASRGGLLAWKSWRFWICRNRGLVPCPEGGHCGAAGVSSRSHRAGRLLHWTRYARRIAIHGMNSMAIITLALSGLLHGLRMSPTSAGIASSYACGEFRGCVQCPRKPGWPRLETVVMHVWGRGTSTASERKRSAKTRKHGDQSRTGKAVPVAIFPIFEFETEFWETTSVNRAATSSHWPFGLLKPIHIGFSGRADRCRFRQEVLALSETSILSKWLAGKARYA